MSKLALRPLARRTLSWGGTLWFLVGCAGGDPESPGEGAPIPLYAPTLPDSDGLLARPDLQEVVDLQVLRDGPALRMVLESSDPALRARAALALGSVQDSESEPALARGLSDSSPAVRRNAAFALGQLVLSDGGAALADALRDEADPQVRGRLIEAIGKRGNREAVQLLLSTAPTSEEAADWTLALARAGIRGVQPAGLLHQLFERLQDPDGEVRVAAAYYFGRTPNTAAWRGEAARLRAALDSYPEDDPAAMHLVMGMGRLVQVPEDEIRVIRWLRSGSDWRTRANAATALLHPVWLASPAIRDALFAALDDPVEHVRVAAAGSLALALWNQGDDWDRGAERVEGPPSDWRVQMALLPPLAQQGFDSLAFAWTRRMALEHPDPTIRGVELIASQSGPEVTDFLFELAGHEAGSVRGAAVQALSRRWPSEGGAEVDARRYFELFTGRLNDSENLPVVRAAEALAHPAMLALGGDDALQRAFETRRPDGDPNVLVPILASMGSTSVSFLQRVLEDPDARLRRAAAESLQRAAGIEVAETRLVGPNPERTVDWPALVALGPEPRVRLETEKGDLVLRLWPEQAPLTVQTFVEQVSDGRHDGVRFHRVMANFVLQGGDVGLGNGAGGPGYEIRSEFTLLPFRRGVLGMASVGKDTEGSQFFAVHSAQPHLDGGYTSFGWIEGGGEVLDELQLGDRVLRAVLLEGSTP